MTEPKKITEVWAWICTEADGGEGIPAMSAPGGMVLPLIGADAERLISLRPAALDVAQGLGLPIKLVRFHQMEVIETLEPARTGQGED